MGCQWLDEALKRLFYRLGHAIGSRPWYFILVPALLTALCITGFQQMDYEYDPEYLFSPVNGLAKRERTDVERFFPTNYTAFKSSRMTRVGKFARLVVTAKDGGTMVRTALWNQLLYLDQIVYNVSASLSGGEGALDTVGGNDGASTADLRYEDLCAKWMGYCYDNEILRLSELVPDVESGEVNLTYPLFFSPYTFERFTLPAFFGGVELSDRGTVSGVGAVALAYFLDSSEDWQRRVGDRWEKALLRDVQTLAEVYAPDLEVGMFVSNTPAWEMEKSRLSVTGTLVFNVLAMIVFSAVAATDPDAARSKPLAGLAGLLSAGLASLAGFGFCCYIGVEFISLVMAAPFLLFGIGIDDTFVTLSSWRRASPHLSVPERMGRAYSDAAVSITVTSLTDFLSFMCGAFTPIPSVRIYCLYTGVAVGFIYIWHVTFFGGCLALAGRAEKSNRHGALPCVEVTPKSRSSGLGCLRRALCTGGIDPGDPRNPADNVDHAGMVFFRDVVGVALGKAWVKTLVLLLYGVYIVSACWGVTHIKEGLEKRNTANYDSYSVKYYDLEDQFFKEYAFTISVVFSGPTLDFSAPDVQDRIELVMQYLENSTYVDARVTQSWLRDFLDYVERTKGFPSDYDEAEGEESSTSSFGLDVSTEKSFARTLREVYLADPWAENNLDVAFSEDGSRVTAARFLIQGHNIMDSYMEQKMVAELRDICHRFSNEDFDVVVFQPFFIYIDQYLAIRPQTIQCVLVTAVVMVVIALVLIPTFVSSLWIALSIFSIQVGVVGFMTWWGVNLDGVALINLIMCIGFSVDFSAHISYHYLTEADKTSDERIRGSLYALGVPILQGAGSTILGVFGLAFAPSYLFVTFFKMIFLVISLGILHGLVLLPVLLSFFGPGSCQPGRGKSSKSTRSSGLSTPTTISCHFGQPRHHQQGFPQQQQQMCYTINMGFRDDENGSRRGSSDNNGASTSSSSKPHCHNHKHHHHHHHRRHHHHHYSGKGGNGDSTSATAAAAAEPSQQKKLAYISSLPDGYAQEYATSTPRSTKNNGFKMSRVKEEEAKRGESDGVREERGPRGHHHKPKNNNVSEESGSSKKTAVADGGGVTNGLHKRAVTRSSSHMPQSYYIAPGFYHPQQQQQQIRSPATEPHQLSAKAAAADQQLLQLQQQQQQQLQHPMLRKYHSFPYHMFTNDAAEYSSSDDGAANRASPFRRHQQRHQLVGGVGAGAGAGGVASGGGLVLRPPRLDSSDDSTGTSSSSSSPDGKRR